MTALDRIDLQLVSLLMKDARTSFADLARAVRRGESTVRERVAHLERDGVLKEYRAIVDSKWLGYPVQAVFRGELNACSVAQLSQGLSSIPNLEEAILTTGAKRLHIRAAFANLSDLESFVDERLGKLPLRRCEVEAVMDVLVTKRPVFSRPMDSTVLSIPVNTNQKNRTPQIPLSGSQMEISEDGLWIPHNGR